MNLYYMAQAAALDEDAYGPTPAYGWVITKDHLNGPDSSSPDARYDDTGTVGPGDKFPWKQEASEEIVAALEAGKGHLFRIYDGDEELYYTGRLYVTDEDSMNDERVTSAPLVDFGQGAGAVEVRYHGHPEWNY